MSAENAEAYEDLGLYDDFDQDPNEKLVDPEVEEVEKLDEGAVASALEADDAGSWRPLTTADVNAQQQRQQQQQQPPQQPQYQGAPEGLGVGNAPAPIPTFASQSETSNFALPPNNTRYQQNPGVNRYAQEGHGGQRRPDFPDENDEGKMFIGGLNWETTDEGLSAYFSQFGVVKDCCIMRDPTGRSRGFAFLTFADPSVIPDVLKRDHNVDGKIIDPKRAIPKAEHAKSQKIFVGGLAPSVTNATLGEFFQQFGGVVDAHVMLDRETSRNKGFGFVTFEDFAGVDRAMQAHNLILEGRPVEIKRAQPKHVRDQQSYNSEWQRPIGSFMSHEAQSSKYKHNAAGGPMGGNPMGGGMGMGMGMGMNPMGSMMGGGGGGGNGFDPNAMAAMYQKMMMNMMMNPMMMNMMNQNKMAGGAGMANPMMAGMMPNMGLPNAGGATSPMANMMGMGAGGGAFNPMMMGMNMGRTPVAGNMTQTPISPSNAASVPSTAGTTPVANSGASIPNAPRGPAAMRQGNAAPPSNAPTGPAATGGQPARYSTQGQTRSKPY